MPVQLFSPMMNALASSKEQHRPLTLPQVLWTRLFTKPLFMTNFMQLDGQDDSGSESEDSPPAVRLTRAQRLVALLLLQLLIC